MHLAITQPKEVERCDIANLSITGLYNFQSNASISMTSLIHFSLFSYILRLLKLYTKVLTKLNKGGYFAAEPNK